MLRITEAIVVFHLFLTGFVLYIFFIMLVLVNLLNGLAISDISAIQLEAEIVSCVSRVELISYIESILLGDPFQFLTNFPESRLAQRLPSCNLFSALYRTSCMQRFISGRGQSKGQGTKMSF